MPTISARCSMRAGEPMRLIATTLVLAFSWMPEAMAWDHLVGGSGLYTGHSTGQLNAEGTAALTFACSLSARGAIMFDVSMKRQEVVKYRNVTIPLTADGKSFAIEAVMTEGGEDIQSVITWGSQAAVTDAAMAVFESDGIVEVRLGEDVLEFAGAHGSENFEKMLKACGRRY